MEYAERTTPECRGRLRADGEGKYGYRAIVPVSYEIPDVVRNSSIVVRYSALVTVANTVGPGVSAAASVLRTTQSPAESPTRHDQCPRFPQAHYGVVSRRRPVPLKRCRQWREEIFGRGRVTSKRGPHQPFVDLFTW